MPRGKNRITFLQSQLGFLIVFLFFLSFVFFLLVSHKPVYRLTIPCWQFLFILSQNDFLAIFSWQNTEAVICLRKTLFFSYHKKFKFSYGYGLATQKEAILSSKCFSIEKKPSLIDFYILFRFYLEWDLTIFLYPGRGKKLKQLWEYISIKYNLSTNNRNYG